MTVLDPDATLSQRFQAVVDGLQSRATLQRFLACLGGGLVLALMVGQQEGSTTGDYGLSFHEGLLNNHRYVTFGLIGIGLFVLLTLWPVLQPFVRSPGAVGVGASAVLVLVAMVLLKWYDPIGKFGPLSDQVGNTPALGFPATFFFSSFGWVLLIVCVVVGIAAVASRLAAIAWALTVLGVFSAFCCYYGHDQVVELAQSRLGFDHSLGVYVATLGYIAFALTGVVVALSRAEQADPRGFADRVMGWRPGFPTAVVAIVLALIALLNASWFSPLGLNRDFRSLSDTFAPTDLDALAKAWTSWLAPTLFAVTALAGLAASYLRHRLGGIVVAVLGLVGLVLNFYSMYAISDTGSRAAAQYGKLWQNLGTGGWVMCIAFSLVVTTGVLTALAERTLEAGDAGAAPAQRLHQAAAQATASPTSRLILPVAIALALFYPPTLTGEWQNTLVTQIGPYLLLAVGLNVVIGWAGLLDLGYIAFYAVGAYTTAYFTGSLPVKPPSWLHFSPLWAIPFAVAMALIAGVLLGAPTLRLRGDYLAIVTLGFGEIIQVVANNNPGGVTGGARGPNVPNPVFEIGGFGIHFGEDNLPYWYLLLFMLVVVTVLFYRLENSRLGRAWAAIREDEIAAQASGVNTTRVKLLAFSIGASTSGLAGVFFATQVGYFDPSLFTLQNSILIVAYVVFGGMGSLPGALAGAAVLTWLPQFLKSQVPQTDQQMWIGALVLLMMIFRPAGLIPAKRRAAELHGLDTPSSSEVRAVPAGEGM